MSGTEPVPLLVGEVYVDVAVTELGTENKLRLGGIAHAARGFWALNAPFRAAVILPSYLESLADNYLKALGCIDFQVMGLVHCAPNVVMIHDLTEVSDQEYDILLREEKTVEILSVNLTGVACRDILIFPGSYDLASVCTALPSAGLLHVDVAYDVGDPNSLAHLPQQIQTILISTSSPLFKSIAANDFGSLTEAFKACGPAALILKENRGGARMFLADTGVTESLPAQLGATVNSVGVGDVFAATFVSHVEHGYVEAGWRATYAAAAYSQTTYPDLFSFIARSCG